MNRLDAYHIAHAIVDNLGDDARRLKAIDVLPRLHSGMLTIRCYFVNTSAQEPESYIFTAEELR